MMLSLKFWRLSFRCRLTDLGLLFGVWSVACAIGSTPLLTAQSVDEKKSDHQNDFEKNHDPA